MEKDESPVLRQSLRTGVGASSLWKKTNPPRAKAEPPHRCGGLVLIEKDESPELRQSLNRSQRCNCSTEYNTPLRYLSRLQTIPSPDIELPLGNPCYAEVPERTIG